MSLRDITIKHTYYGDDGVSILKDFYAPALDNAIKYDRITGYFSPKVLAIAARGFAGLITNGGRVRLITSVALDEETMSAVKASKDSSLLEPFLLGTFTEIVSDLERNYLNSFAKLLQEGKIEMRVVCLPQGGILHEKIGIIEDVFGNKISFNGSNNETISGWMRNIESFRVFCSWDEWCTDYIKADEENFEKLWNSNYPEAITLPVDKAIKEKLIQTYGGGGDNPGGSGRDNPPGRGEDKLRWYQKEAIRSWRDNGFRGIFEMATGTGKTWTGLYALKQLMEESNCRLYVITVPLKHLIPQWMDDITTIFPEARTIQISSENPTWRNELPQIIRSYAKKYTNDITIAISTYSSFSTDDFREIMTSYDTFSPFEKCILADEVHNAKTEKILNNAEIFDYKLGLSATPKNEYAENDDPESNVNRMIEGFGGIIYRYTLDQAINEGYLVRFEYYPIFLELDEQEIEKYLKYTKQISAILNGDEIDYDALTRISNKRASVVKKAESKKYQLPNTLADIKAKGQHRYMLVYCDDMNQISDAQRALFDNNIVSCKVTYEETIAERQKLFDLFAKGQVDCLVARKCLDEGVNIPATQTAILIASNTDQREYIQRLGRILRTYEGKNKSVIYDMVILPPSDNGAANGGRFEKTVINELRRMEFFSRNSINSNDVIEQINVACNRYNISIDDLRKEPKNGQD